MPSSFVAVNFIMSLLYILTSVTANVCLVHVWKSSDLYRQEILKYPTNFNFIQHLSVPFVSIYKY